MTLRLRLSLAFLVVVVGPLLITAVVVGRGIPEALDHAADTRVTAARAAAGGLLDQTCVEAGLAAEILAREAAHSGTGGARDVVSRGIADYAVVTDPTGGVQDRAGTPPASIASARLGACYEATSQAGPPLVLDAVQVRGPNGEDQGRAVAAILLDDGFCHRVAAATNADVALVVDHHVVASTVDAADAARLAAVGGSSDVVHVGGRTAASTPAGAADLVVSVGRTGASGLEAVLIGALLAALVLSAVIGWLLARVTTRPLAELSDAAARVAAGDLDTHIDTRSRDEIGQLARAFNDMTRELRTHVGALELSRDELRRNLARLGDTLSGTHDLGRILGVIVDTAIGSVRARAGSAYVIQPGSNELSLSAARGLDPGLASRIPVGEGVAGSVASSGQAIWGRVATEQIELSPLEPSATDLISVPMRTGSGIVGVLNLYDRTDGRPYDVQDLDTIRTFAGQAAVAIDNVLLHQEAQRLSVTDALTGLGNYRFFQATLGREIERASRFSRELALLMLDLDRFKQVNDTHGHQVGDAVLTEVARRVQAEVREVDMVARYGGEEFVVLLPETDSAGAEHTAERICAAIRETPFDVANIRLPVTLSAGVAVFPIHASDGTSLVRAADKALYAAKKGGRDGWRMARARATRGSR